MNKNERLVVAACADTMFPPAGPIPVSGTEAGIATYVDDTFLRGMPWKQRFLIHMLLLFIQLSPLLFGPRRSRFTHLSPADRLRVLEDMATSPLRYRRIAFLAILGIMLMGYLDHQPVVSLITHQHRNEAST